MTNTDLLEERATPPLSEATGATRMAARVGRISRAFQLLRTGGMQSPGAGSLWGTFALCLHP